MMDPNYQSPLSLFEPKRLHTQIQKVTLKSYWPKKGNIEGYSYDGNIYIGQFLYKKFPISAIEILPKVDRRKFQLFKDNIADFERNDSEFINQMNEIEKKCLLNQDQESETSDIEDYFETENDDNLTFIQKQQNQSSLFPKTLQNNNTSKSQKSLIDFFGGQKKDNVFSTPSLKKIPDLIQSNNIHKDIPINFSFLSDEYSYSDVDTTPSSSDSEGLTYAQYLQLYPIENSNSTEENQKQSSFQKSDNTSFIQDQKDTNNQSNPPQKVEDNKKTQTNQIQKREMNEIINLNISIPIGNSTIQKAETSNPSEDSAQVDNKLNEPSNYLKSLFDVEPDSDTAESSQQSFAKPFDETDQENSQDSFEFLVNSKKLLQAKMQRNREQSQEIPKESSNSNLPNEKILTVLNRLNMEESGSRILADNSHSLSSLAKKPTEQNNITHSLLLLEKESTKQNNNTHSLSSIAEESKKQNNSTHSLISIAEESTEQTNSTHSLISIAEESTEPTNSSHSPSSTEKSSTKPVYDSSFFLARKSNFVNSMNQPNPSKQAESSKTDFLKSSLLSKKQLFAPTNKQEPFEINLTVIEESSPNTKESSDSSFSFETKTDQAKSISQMAIKPNQPAPPQPTTGPTQTTQPPPQSTTKSTQLNPPPLQATARTTQPPQQSAIKPNQPPPQSTIKPSQPPPQSAIKPTQLNPPPLQATTRTTQPPQQSAVKSTQLNQPPLQATARPTHPPPYSSIRPAQYVPPRPKLPNTMNENNPHIIPPKVIRGPNQQPKINSLRVELSNFRESMDKSPNDEQSTAKINEPNKADASLNNAPNQTDSPKAKPLNRKHFFTQLSENAQNPMHHPKANEQSSVNSTNGSDSSKTMKSDSDASHTNHQRISQVNHANHSAASKEKEKISPSKSSEINTMSKSKIREQSAMNNLNQARARDPNLQNHDKISESSSTKLPKYAKAAEADRLDQASISESKSETSIEAAKKKKKKSHHKTAENQPEPETPKDHKEKTESSHESSKHKEKAAKKKTESTSKEEEQEKLEYSDQHVLQYKSKKVKKMTDDDFLAGLEGIKKSSKSKTSTTNATATATATANDTSIRRIQSAKAPIPEIPVNIEQAQKSRTSPKRTTSSIQPEYEYGHIRSDEVYNHKKVQDANEHRNDEIVVDKARYNRQKESVIGGETYSLIELDEFPDIPRTSNRYTDRDIDRHRDRDRDRERDRDRIRDRDIGRERERDIVRDRERDIVRDIGRDRERDRERDIGRDRERDIVRDRVRERDLYRERDRNRVIYDEYDRHRSHHHRERYNDYDYDYYYHRDRHRDRDNHDYG